MASNIIPIRLPHANDNDDLPPAPDFAALAEKIEIAHKDSLFDGSDVSDAAIESIVADVRRLGGVA